MILLLNWRNVLRNALLPAWKTPCSLIGLCAERLTTNFVSITYEKQISSWRRPFYLVALLRNWENMLKNSNMPRNLLQSIWSAKGRYPRQTKAQHQSTFLTANFAVVDIIVEIAQHDCGAPNHFAQCCPKKQRRSNPQQACNRPIHEITHHPDLREDEWENFVGAITVESLGEEKDVNETTLHSNNAEERYWNGLSFWNQMEPTLTLNLTQAVKLIFFQKRNTVNSSTNLSYIQQKWSSPPTMAPTYQSSASASSLWRTDIKNTKFSSFLAEMDSVPLIGLNTCKKLDLINRVMTVDCEYSSLINEYSDCFGEIGSLSKVHHLTIDGNFPPVIQAPRKVPFALHEKLKDELNRMMCLGIIDKVDGPTDLVPNLVIVEKPNARVPWPLRSQSSDKEATLPATHCRRYSFSNGQRKVTGTGYWQLKLDEESSKLLAFRTLFGCYKFKRLLFGVNCASEIFQAEVTEILEALEGCANAQDDIVVWATQNITMIGGSRMFSQGFAFLVLNWIDRSVFLDLTK